MTDDLSDLGYHDGYAGAFSRNQSAGALPNGTRIKKRNSEPGDATPNGTFGTILGSAAHPEMMLYFVEWDDKPRIAIGTIESKVELAELTEGENDGR